MEMSKIALLKLIACVAILSGTSACYSIWLPGDVPDIVEQFQADRNENERLAALLKGRFDKQKVTMEKSSYDSLVVAWDDWARNVRDAIKKGKKLSESPEYAPAAKLVSTHQVSFRRLARERLNEQPGAAMDYSPFAELGLKAVEACFHAYVDRKRNQAAQKVYAESRLKPWAAIQAGASGHSAGDS
jgi:hypothetical protein